MDESGKGFIRFTNKEQLLPQEEMLEAATAKRKLSIGIPKETLGDSVAGRAQNAHAVYRRYRREGRPPFLVLRSSFQSPQFLVDVFAEMQRQDAAGEVLSDTGAVLHPNYRLLDPYTFFALLEQRLSF